MRSEAGGYLPDDGFVWLIVKVSPAETHSRYFDPKKKYRKL